MVAVAEWGTAPRCILFFCCALFAVCRLGMGSCGGSRFSGCYLESYARWFQEMRELQPLQILCSCALYPNMREFRTLGQGQAKGTVLPRTVLTRGTGHLSNHTIARSIEHVFFAFGMGMLTMISPLGCQLQRSTAFGKHPPPQSVGVVSRLNCKCMSFASHF